MAKVKKKSNIKSIWVNRKKRINKSEFDPDYEVSNLNEIIERNIIN